MSVTPIRSNSLALKNSERDWFTGPEVCTLAGLTYRQFDYWTRTGLLVPIDGKATPGQGNYRCFTPAELGKARAIKALVDAGLDLRYVRQHIDQFLLTGRLAVGAVTITYIPEQ